MRKLLSLFLAAVMVILTVPMTAATVSAETEGLYTYEIADGCATITDVDKTISGNVTLPDKLGGYPVTGIGDHAFAHCKSLISITISDGVTSIGNEVFYLCESLTHITIPDSVTRIWQSVFNHCRHLTSIEVSEGNTAYSSIEGVLFSKDATYLIRYPENKDCSKYIIPDSVTGIGNDAFNGCMSLTSITIPNNVTNIGFNAFYRCTSLTSITIPDGVTNIGWNAFTGCTSLTSITIPDSVTSIFSGAFEECTSLTSITIPDSVTRIDNGVFLGCTSLTSITIPDSVTIIGDNAFRRCTSLTSITIPNSVTEIFGGAFAHCTSLTSITIPDSVTSIDNNVFSGCISLTSITIPDGVTSIGFYTFSSCTSLTSITIPDSVISVDKRAFEGCTSLTDVYYAGSREDWGKISIDSDNTALTEAPRIHYNTSSAEGHYEIVTTTPPTCTEVGHGTEVCPCGYSRNEVTIPASHSLVQHPAQSPTCTEGGWFAYETCERCDYTTFVALPKLGHTYENGICIRCNERDPSAIILGDADGDGAVGIGDAITILKHVAGWQGITIDTDAADVDANGKVDLNDAILILKKIAGWAVDF